MTKPHINWEVNVSTIVTLCVLFFGGIGAWFTMPQQIMANCEMTFARKDVLAVELQAIREQQKSIIGMLRLIANKKGVM